MALKFTSVAYVILQVKKKTENYTHKKATTRTKDTQKINEWITESKQSKLFLWLLKY